MNHPRPECLYLRTNRVQCLDQIENLPDQHCRHITRGDVSKLNEHSVYAISDFPCLHYKGQNNNNCYKPKNKTLWLAAKSEIKNTSITKRRSMKRTWIGFEVESFDTALLKLTHATSGNQPVNRIVLKDDYAISIEPTYDKVKNKWASNVKDRDVGLTLYHQEEKNWAEVKISVFLNNSVQTLNNSRAKDTMVLDILIEDLFQVKKDRQNQILQNVDALKDLQTTGSLSQNDAMQILQQICKDLDETETGRELSAIIKDIQAKSAEGKTHSTILADLPIAEDVNEKEQSDGWKKTLKRELNDAKGDIISIIVKTVLEFAKASS